MAESTLSIQLSNLRSSVGFVLGFGHLWESFDEDKQWQVTTAISDGYRSFLFPPPLPGENFAHRWSFLTSSTTLVAWAAQSSTAAAGTTGATLVAAASVFQTTGTMVGQPVSFTTSGNSYTISSVTNATTVVLTSSLDDADNDVGDAFTIAAGDYSLPDDFGDIIGRMTFSTTDGYAPLERVSDEQIRVWRQGSSTTGRPHSYAIRPRNTAGTSGQRFELLLWPTPDSSYTLHYAYDVMVNDLTDAAPFPLGGMAHGETIRAACLAAAERLKQPDASQTPRERIWLDRLKASVMRDRKNRARYYGRNFDPSIRRSGRYDDCMEYGDITVNNVLY